MAGSRTPAAENCQAGARSAGYRRMRWLPTGARGAFGGQEPSRWLDFLTRGLQPGVRAGSSGAKIASEARATGGPYASNRIRKTLLMLHFWLLMMGCER